LRTIQKRSLLPSATVSALLHLSGVATASPFLDFVQQDPLGVGGVSDAVVSPDGAHLYVASFGEDAIAVLARDAGTGGLTPVEVLHDGVGGVDGLDGVEDVVVSPDGAHVYAAAREEDAVSVFARNAGTGALTFLAVIRQGDPGIDGLNGARSLAIGPDGGTL
jgi:DNA-binding beta-propeller fold protein YncE